MLSLKWTDDMNLGVEVVDNQHKHLVELLNQLASDVDKLKRGLIVNEDLKEIANELIDYTHEHFSDEEALYLRNGINITEHAKLHEAFRLEIEEVKLLLTGEEGKQNSNELLKVYSSLLTWVMEHIKVEDRAMWLQ